MAKKLLSALVATVMVFGCLGLTAGAKSDETVIVLSDSGITVDGSDASTAESSAVYIANDIIYYASGTDSSYGEGTQEDMHTETEAAAHTVVHITEAGTYRISGTLSAGQIFVDLGDDASSDSTAVVTLILDGVDITCTVGPAIFFYSVYECSDSSVDTSGTVDTTAAGANVIIADGSTNTVNGSYVAKIYKEDTTKKLHKYDGAFYSKMSMNIDGETGDTGKLYINAENEGLDSELHLTINGGCIYIESQDDGINTNEDGISVTTVNGGYLYVNAGLGSEGDGIDSNGYLTINGGTIVTLANGISGDGGIDADGAININGGNLIALGSRNDATSSSSQQVYMELSFASTHSAGSVIKITDADGNVLFNYTTEKVYQSATFSCADFELDTVYYVYVDGVSQQYTGNSFGMGGMGGMMGGTPGEMPDSGMAQGDAPAENNNGTTGGTMPGFGGQQPDMSQMPEMGEQPQTDGSTGMPGMNGQTAADTQTGEGSEEFIMTASVKSFSGVTDSDTSGKTKVTFSVNDGEGIEDVASGETVTVSSITASEDVSGSDVQITITDDPSESYSKTCMLSDGMDALADILPTDDGSYLMTIAVVSSNETYTGVTQINFTIGESTEETDDSDDTTGLPFNDVNKNSSEYRAVQYLYSKGVMNGTSSNTFSPNSSLTRAMAATVLGRIVNAETSDSSTFADVTSGTWYSGYVGWAAQNGIVQGYGNGQFGTDDEVTGTQFQLMLTRCAELLGVTYTPTVTATDEPLTRAALAEILYDFCQQAGL